MDTHGEMIIYQTEDGLTKIDVNMQDETVWLSLEQMSDLFQRDKSTIYYDMKGRVAPSRESYSSYFAGNIQGYSRKQRKKIARTDPFCV